MAVVAGDARRRMREWSNLSWFRPVMWQAQAPGRVFLRAGVERENQLGARKFFGGVARRVLFGIGMGFTGSVAGLTPGNDGDLRRGGGLGLCRQRPVSVIM